MPWSCLALCEWLCLIGLQLLENHTASAAQFSPKQYLGHRTCSRRIFLLTQSACLSLLLSPFLYLWSWFWILQTLCRSLFTLFHFHRFTDVCNCWISCPCVCCMCAFVFLMNILISWFKIDHSSSLLLIIIIVDWFGVAVCHLCFI